MRAPDGMVPCRVENHHTAWLVSFPAKRLDCLLQSDWDQSVFLSRSLDSRGKPLVATPRDWDGRPSTLPGFGEVDESDIRYCPDDYLDLVERARAPT